MSRNVFGETTAALGVTTAMKVKQKMEMGLKKRKNRSHKAAGKLTFHQMYVKVIKHARAAARKAGARKKSHSTYNSI